MSITIDVDISGPERLADSMGMALENQIEGLLQAVETVVLPEVQTESASVWNVRTGAYSNGWFAAPSSPYSVSLYNSVDYVFPLEYGWTTRGGGFKDSPGVAEPVAVATAPEVAGMLVDWLNSQLSQ